MRIRAATAAALDHWHEVPCAFEIREVVDVVRLAVGAAGCEVPCRPVVARRKDYDALPENHPRDWARVLDLQGWLFLQAWRGEHVVGGAIVAFADPGVPGRGLRLPWLRAHPERAVLWDLRVAPEARGTGVGRALLEASRRAMTQRGRSVLLVETQDTNAAACRFYARCGGAVVAIEPGAYPELPDEVRVVWAFGAP